MNAAIPSLPREVATDWYRQPSVKVAFVLSLLVHAGVILSLPGLRVPVPSEPPPMVVELAPMPEPVVTPPPPVPEPKRAPAAAPRLPPPPVKEKPPEPPPVIARIVPQPEAPPEVRVPPQPEPKPEPKPPPAPEPRVEAPPPPVAPPRPEPPLAAVEPAVKAAAPAPPAPTAPDPGLLKAYGNVLAQAIGQRKNYPRLARMRNWQGTTELRLQIGTDGKLRDLTVTHSSGYDLLDQQAIAMVKQTLPLPQLPATLRGTEVAVTVPVVFKLE